MLPAGKYYIGDPCYVIPDGEWDEFVGAMYEGRRMHPLTEFEFKGNRVWCHSTASGDGDYDGSDGNSYPVDSGTLGAIPVALIDEDAVDGDMVFIEVDRAWVPMYDNGTFYFNHITINTDFSNEEDPY